MANNLGTGDDIGSSTIRGKESRTWPSYTEICCRIPDSGACGKHGSAVRPNVYIIIEH